MTERISNTKFLTVFDPLPVDGIGWEVVAFHVGSNGDLNVMQRVYRFAELSGSKVRNDFGSGTVVIPKDDVLWDEPLPSPLTGENPLDHEFLWRVYEGSVLRHEFFGEDIKEDVAVENESPRLITIGGRTPEVCLSWAVHVPAWAELQEITLNNSAVSGSFTLRYGAYTTAPIAHNASAATLKAALVAAVPSISASDLEVTYLMTDEVRRWTVRFVGQFIQDNARPIGFLPGTTTVVDADASEIAPETSEISQVDYHADPEPRTAASVFLDSLARAQSRGVIPFVEPLFDATTDSFGDAWTDLDVQEIGVGETLLSMLKRFSEAYGWEFRMLPGWRLQVVQQGFGTNRSDVSRFWLGGHQISHTLSRTSREIATRVWAQTSQNHIVRAEGGSPATGLMREVWIDGFEGDPSFAQKVARTTYEERFDHVRLRDVKFPYRTTGAPRPFDDFGVCDWIAVEDDRHIMHLQKIETLTWKVDSQAPVDFEVTFFGEQPV